MAKHRSVHSTLKHWINTVGNIRHILNKIRHYNPATQQLHAVDIIWFLHSPLASVIKNIIFFQIVYYTVLTNMRRDYIIKLLETIGLKAEGELYYEELLKVEASVHQGSLRLHDEIYHPELLHPPTPKPSRNISQEVFEEFNKMHATHIVYKAELESLQTEYDLILAPLLEYHDKHVLSICMHAHEHGIRLEPHLAMMAVPKAIELYRTGQSVSEQIRALGLLNNDDLNNVVRLQSFLRSPTLHTRMARYEEGLKPLAAQVNRNLSLKTAEVIDCKMRLAELESRIQQAEAIVNKAQENIPKLEAKSATAELSSSKKPDFVPEPPAKSAFAAEIEYAQKTSQKSLADLFRPTDHGKSANQEELDAQPSSAPAA
jgi:hypothetical protein